jgi:hypothetical protein
MMIVQRIGVLSVGKMMGLTYAIIGFIPGVIVSLAALAGAGLGGGGGGAGLLFGVGAVIILPIFYGGIGFVGGIISAAIYNALVSVVGGIEIDLTEPRSSRRPRSRDRDDDEDDRDD